MPSPFPVDPERSRLDQILDRGVLRVGFQQDQLPFAFVNSEGQAVGFDLEMANHLATDLGVALELVRLERGLQADRLVDGTCDIVMGGLVVTPSKVLQVTFSQPYLDQILAVIVRDHRQRDFSNRERIRKLETLRVGIVPSLLDWAPRLQTYAPQVEIVELASPRPFLRGEREDLDALFYSAEAGSAWTLLYPEFSVAVPREQLVKVPMAYALPPGEVAFTNYINSWIETRRRDGTIERLFDHWILGGGAHEVKQRWSVIRDVLGWVE